MENNEVSMRVRNKDVPILSNYLIYKVAIEKLEEQIEWEHDRKINISQHITGMPNGKGGVNGLDNTFARIDILEQKHRKEVEQYRRCIKAADKILEGIDSVSMRMFVRMMYMELRPNTEVQRELKISRRGFDRARRCIENAPDMASVKWPERYILIQDDLE